MGSKPEGPRPICMWPCSPTTRLYTLISDLPMSFLLSLLGYFAATIGEEADAYHAQLAVYSATNNMTAEVMTEDLELGIHAMAVTDRGVSTALSQTLDPAKFNTQAGPGGEILYEDVDLDSDIDDDDKIAGTQQIFDQAFREGGAAYSPMPLTPTTQPPFSQPVDPVESPTTIVDDLARRLGGWQRPDDFGLMQPARTQGQVQRCIIWLFAQK